MREGHFKRGGTYIEKEHGEGNTLRETDVNRKNLEKERI